MLLAPAHKVRAENGIYLKNGIIFSADQPAAGATVQAARHPVRRHAQRTGQGPHGRI